MFAHFLPIPSCQVTKILVGADPGTKGKRRGPGYFLRISAPQKTLPKQFLPQHQLLISSLTGETELIGYRKPICP